MIYDVKLPEYAKNQTADSGASLLMEKRLGMGFSLQGSPSFNTVDTLGLPNKCVVN